MISTEAYVSGKGARLLRSENGALLRRRRTEISRVDKDVLAYCAKGQTTKPSRTGIDALNTFTKTIKAMGLWGDMVCWIGRRGWSSLNDTTVYSLGGWTTADGTASNINITNRVDALGLEFIAVPSRRNITATISGKNNLQNFHCVATFRVTAVLGMPSVGDAVFLNPWYLRQNTDQTIRATNGTNNIDLIYSSTTLFTTFHFGQSESTGYLQTGSTRSTSTPGSAVNLSGDDISIGSHPTEGTPFNQLRARMPFCALFKKSLSADQSFLITQLLQRTILKGLQT
jgi:hypothetical protein